MEIGESLLKYFRKYTGTRESDCPPAVATRLDDGGAPAPAPDRLTVTNMLRQKSSMVAKDYSSSDFSEHETNFTERL